MTARIPPKLRLVSWNIARRPAPWSMLASESSIDVALLQEAGKPDPSIKCETVPTLDEPWITAGATRPYCAAIAQFSDRVSMRPIPIRPLAERTNRDLGASRPGTLAAAELKIPGGETIVVASVYGYWETASNGRTLFADGSVHRIISDLSYLVVSSKKHQVIVAGDLNVLYGYGERGSDYWKGRYNTVFARMESIGLPFVGPQAPDGIRADPWPKELPRHSRNVPTFRTRLSNPATATRQLDFVFASRDLHGRLKVRALNAPCEWGPSDHCRILIDLP